MAITTGTYASRPSSHSAGDIYLTTDSFWDYLVSDGAKWRHLYCGFECEPPVDSEFSWVNQGGASVITTNGGVFMRAPAGASTNYRIRKKVAPAAPYELTAILLPSIVGVPGIGSRLSVGIAHSLASDGRFRVLEISSYAMHFEVREHLTPTDGGAEITTYNPTINISSSAIWLKIADDNTDVTYSLSLDGKNFLTIYSIVRTNFFTTYPDELCFILNAQDANYDCGATLIHWSQPNPAAPMRVFGMFGVLPSFEPTGNYFGAFG